MSDTRAPVRDAGARRWTRRGLIQIAATSAFVYCAFTVTDSAARQEDHIMATIPAPRSFLVDEDVSLTVDDSTSIVALDPTLEAIGDWLATEVRRSAGISLARGSSPSSSIELVIDETIPSLHPTAGIRADNGETESERYTLTVSATGVRVAGATAEGVFRGATTLFHLIAASPEEAGATLQGLTISDSPRFAWRGLSFDVVRTFHPVETVRKVIDVLALYKMNVLHLHLTDSEGWRFEVPGYPALTEVSGQTARNDRPGGHYTQEEYAGIVTYAASRFITIVPEFDSPGHTASVLRAYPELGTPEILAFPEAMQYLHPDVAGVPELVESVYLEMARVHPGDRLHIGGDEAIAMDEETFSRYMNMAMPAARATGKGIVAWQETARAGFAEGDLMQYWIPPHLVQRVREALESPEGSWLEHGFPDTEVREAFVELFLQAPEDLPKALEQGANIILSRADKLYLDTRYAEPSTDPAQTSMHERIGMPNVVYGSGTVRDSYEWDPATLEQDLPLDRIAGIEAAIWCETIEDESDLLFQLLPRLPGVAEKAWSDSQTWGAYQPRLAAQARIWDANDWDYFRSSVVWQE
jgi:hexosaminidase